MSQTSILLESGTNELEIVEFFIDEVNADGEVYRGYYGINVAKVVEIIRKQELTVVPSNETRGLSGMFPFRDGKVIPLIDLASFFGKKTVKVSEPKLIVTEFNKTQNAFIVSGVNRIYRLSWADVEAPSKLVQDACDGYITSIVRIENRVVLVLDFEAIVAELTPQLAMKEYTPDPPKEGEEFVKFKIVHAEDSSSIRRLIMTILQNDGRFEVLQFEDGQAAYEYLKSVRDKVAKENLKLEDFVNGVVTDIEMPNLDGLSLCKLVKGDPLLKQLPVAIFSSLITEGTTHKANSVGADAQFAKPELKLLADNMYDLMLQHA